VLPYVRGRREVSQKKDLDGLAKKRSRPAFSFLSGASSRWVQGSRKEDAEGRGYAKGGKKKLLRGGGLLRQVPLRLKNKNACTRTEKTYT